MKIGVIQASTRTDINGLLYDVTVKTVGARHDVFNLGIFSDEQESYSYVEVAVMISLLIETGSLDFVVTGCSSGQGMMMACNSLPGLRCGFVQTPQDAFLFGRINNGNVVSFPLGLNFGWAGELNLQYMLEKLFTGEFGTGYPLRDADRKQQEAQELLTLHQLSTKSFEEILDELEPRLLKKLMTRNSFFEFLNRHATNATLFSRLKLFRN